MEILFVIAFYIGFFTLIGVLIKKGNKKQMFNREGLGFISKVASKEQLKKIVDYEHAKKLAEWQKAGLISADQAKSLTETEVKKKFALHFSIFNSLLYLGIGCIVVGVIALVAANYDKIPPILRLFTVLVLLTASSVTAVRLIDKKKQYLAEACLLACIGLVGAAIGLSQQIFHLFRHTEDVVFLWSVLSLPYVLFSHKKFLSWAWYPLFLITFSASSFGQEFWETVAKTFTLQAFFVSLCFMSFALMSVFRKIALPFTRAGKDWLNVVILFSIIMIDVILTGRGRAFYYWHYYIHMGNYLLSDMLLLTISAAACVPAMLKSEKLYKCLWGVGLVYGALICLRPFPIWGILLTLTATGFVAYVAAKKNSIRLFNLMAFLFFGRIVLAYFNLFMSLAKTGVGAILIGVLILLGLKIWASKKQNLINYIQKGN